MPKLTVDGNLFDVPQDKRLVNALLDEAKIDQLHAYAGECAVHDVPGAVCFGGAGEDDGGGEGGAERPRTRQDARSAT